MKLKELLDKLGLEVLDNWETIQKYSQKTLHCKYYTFKIGKKVYCASSNGISVVLSKEDDPFNMLYMGYSLQELEKVLNKLIKKGK